MDCIKAASQISDYISGFFINFKYLLILYIYLTLKKQWKGSSNKASLYETKTLLIRWKLIPSSK
jgi:hypothetical protein